MLLVSLHPELFLWDILVVLAVLRPILARYSMRQSTVTKTYNEEKKINKYSGFVLNSIRGTEAGIGVYS